MRKFFLLTLTLSWLCLPSEATDFTQAQIDCMNGATASFRSAYVTDISDGCFERARRFYTYLIDRCPSVRTFVVQHWLAGVMNPARGINWRYHTALVILNGTTPTILDPTFSGSMMPIRDWQARCNPTGTTRSDFTVCGATSPIISGGQPAGASAPITAPSLAGNYRTTPAPVYTAPAPAPTLYYAVTPGYTYTPGFYIPAAPAPVYTMPVGPVFGGGRGGIFRL